MMLLAVENLCFNYTDKPLLKDVSLYLNEGEKINYKATVTKGSEWEGSAATSGVFSSDEGFVLSSNTNKSLKFETNVKGEKSTFETFGKAKVEIELNDDEIGSRNPNGVYKSTMTLTLKNGG